MVSIVIIRHFSSFYVSKGRVLNTKKGQRLNKKTLDGILTCQIIILF